MKLVVCKDEFVGGTSCHLCVDKSTLEFLGTLPSQWSESKLGIACCAPHSVLCRVYTYSVRSTEYRYTLLRARYEGNLVVSLKSTVSIEPLQVAEDYSALQLPVYEDGNPELGREYMEYLGQFGTNQ